MARPEASLAMGNGSSAIVDIEVTLWLAADKLRNNMDLARGTPSNDDDGFPKDTVPMSLPLIYA